MDNAKINYTEIKCGFVLYVMSRLNFLLTYRLEKVSTGFFFCYYQHVRFIQAALARVCQDDEEILVHQLFFTLQTLKDILWVAFASASMSSL